MSQLKRPRPRHPTAKRPREAAGEDNGDASRARTEDYESGSLGSAPRGLHRESTLQVSNSLPTPVPELPAASAAALANPLVAEAAVTPSLKNTLLSVVAGGLVLGAIAAAVIGVSTFDKVSRK